MDANEIPLIWQSRRPPPRNGITYQGQQYSIKLVDSKSDIRVFDATEWSSFDEAVSHYELSNQPTLVIARDCDEHGWLEYLVPEHGMCPESKVDENLGVLLVRLNRRLEDRRRLKKQSLVDPLTSALPRNELYRRLELELETLNHENPVSLLILDIDHFKRINDNYGHAEGDKILKHTGRILNEAVRGAPDVFRFSGEEFAILGKMNRTQATALGEYILHEIEEHDFSIADTTIHVTASIGVAITADRKEPKILIEHADTALYEAKTLGRNRVIEYDGFTDEVTSGSGDPMIRDFENRIKVITERLAEGLAARSKQIVSDIRREADFDGLTGLYVRKYFDRRLTREFEVAHHMSTPLSLIFIDLDHFGMVNKTYGFPTGDNVLKSVSEAVLVSIREVDWAARYGGEELCVILPNTTEKEACVIAERIWKKIGEQVVTSYDGQPVLVTASAGVAQLTKEDVELKDFVQRTSDRTRYAKRNGRNQVCCKDA